MSLPIQIVMPTPVTYQDDYSPDSVPRNFNSDFSRSSIASIEDEEPTPLKNDGDELIFAFDQEESFSLGQILQEQSQQLETKV